jgi:hypothetical protein
MDFAWKVFDKVADVIGPFGAVGLFGIILVGAVYWVMSPRR